MKVIGLGKIEFGRPKTLLIEMKDDEWANLIGYYSLYVDKLPQPEVGAEFTISDLFSKAGTLKNSNYCLEQIEKNVKELLGALPKNV